MAYDDSCPTCGLPITYALYYGPERWPFEATGHTLTMRWDTEANTYRAEVVGTFRRHVCQEVA